MIVVLLGVELVELAYVGEVDEGEHVLLEQKIEGVSTVAKNGRRVRELLELMVKLKADKIQNEGDNQSTFSSPLFVCLSPKTRIMAQPIFKALLPQFESELIYFNINKKQFKGVPFNRPILVDRQICYGEGFGELRIKQEMKIALASLIGGQTKIQYVFIENNPNELKQLKKEGFTSLVDHIDPGQLLSTFERALANLSKGGKMEQKQEMNQLVARHPFARQYLRGLFRVNKDSTIKVIAPFDTTKLTIKGLLGSLCSPSTYYNITPKSWVRNSGSKSISSYTFHNQSDQHLYTSRTSKPKDFSNQQQYQYRILAHSLSYLVDPDGLSVPQDKNTTLMKCCKVKSFENKKAFLSVRPYIQGLTTLSECGLALDDFCTLLKNGTLYGRCVRGLAGQLLLSLIINEHFELKSWSEQVCFAEFSKEGKLTMVNRNSLRESQSVLFVCRTDYFNIFDSSQFKLFSESFTIHRSSAQTLSIALKQLGRQCLQEMQQLLFDINEERLLTIKNLCLWYKWSCKLSHLHEIISYRINALRELLSSIDGDRRRRRSLLVQYPQLVCLMMPQKYERFMAPTEDIFSSMQLPLRDQIAQKKLKQNPYITYLNKTCNFAVYQSDFPILTFLQWVKSTNRFQVIEYMSMLDHTLEDYQVLDKRLKLVSVNEKKNVILVLDHVEFCQQIVQRVKAIKTVMLFRLKKNPQVDQMGLITGNVDRKINFQESEDQIISALLKWGGRDQLFPSRLELVGWCLQASIKVRSMIYSLPSEISLKYLMTLHQGISTNRHRLRELEQASPESRHLYVFPIVKQQQKIVLNYQLYQFLHTKKIIFEILGKTWSHKLLTYQNAAVGKMRTMVDGQTIRRVVHELQLYLEQLSHEKMQGAEYQELTNDSLQLVATLTHNQSSTRDSIVDELPFEVFPATVRIRNYFKIVEAMFVSNTFVVVNDQNLEMMTPSQHIVLPLVNAGIVAVGKTCSSLLLLASESITQPGFLYLQELQITPHLLELNFLSFKIQNVELIVLLNSQPWQNILISKHQNHLYLILSINKCLLIVVFDLTQPVFLACRQLTLNKELIDIQLLSTSNGVQLFIADNQSVFKMLLTPIVNKLEFSSLVTVDYGLTHILLKKTPQHLHIFSHKLHIIDHFIFDNHQIINSYRYQLTKSIKTISAQYQRLYVFYNNCDSFDVMMIKGGQLHKVWSYYWVDPNVQTAYPCDQHLFLRGISYVKHIRLRNKDNLHQKQNKILL